jgi:uncharacterized OB-fold protein
VYHSDLAGPAWRSELPYVVAVIRLAYSGVKILSQLQGEAVNRVHIGLDVQVVFAPVNEQITLPKFVGLAAGAGCEDAAR